MKKEKMIKEFEKATQKNFERMGELLKNIHEIIEDKEDDNFLKIIQILEISKDLEAIKIIYLENCDVIRLLEKVE